MNADADSPAPRHGQPTEPDYLSAGYVAQVLAELVRIPSTNPGAYESDVARRVVKYFEATPVEAKLVESLPGRHSVGWWACGMISTSSLRFAARSSA